MSEPPEISLDFYDLVDFTVDGRLVDFTSATITQETEWVGSGEAQHLVRSWHGQIVTYDRLIDSALLHTLVGRTDDSTLEGFFRISHNFSRSIDIEGSGALIVALGPAEAT